MGYRITVDCFGLTDKQVEKLFDRVMKAAHRKDQEVMCSGGPIPDEEVGA